MKLIDAAVVEDIAVAADEVELPDKHLDGRRPEALQQLEVRSSARKVCFACSPP